MVENYYVKYYVDTLIFFNPSLLIIYYIIIYPGTHETVYG